MHIPRLSLLSVALLAAACTPPHIGRSDGSVDRPEVSGSGGGAGGAGGMAGAGSGGSAGAAGSCGTPSIEGVGCGTPAQFNFDTSLQGWRGDQATTSFTSVSNLQTWCTHTWCGNGAMTFDCSLNTTGGAPAKSECPVQVTNSSVFSTLTATSVITFGLKAVGLSTDDWLRVFVILIDQQGYSRPIFAGTARTNSWYRFGETGTALFSADLSTAKGGSGDPLSFPIRGMQIYVDVNDTVTWTGVIWIDEVGWK